MKFKQIFAQLTVDLSTTFFSLEKDKKKLFKLIYDSDELRKASWNGIPRQYRAQAWKLLCVRFFFRKKKEN